MRSVVLVALLLVSTPALAQTTGTTYTTPAPVYLYPANGTAVATRDNVLEDPGFWIRTFYGWDRNGDQRYVGDERGLALLVWDWLYSMMINAGMFMLEAIWNVLPNNWKPVVPDIAYYVAVANYWLPLDVLVILASIYGSFQTTVTVIRHILMWLPGMGR